MTAGQIKSACPALLAKRFLQPAPRLQGETTEPRRLPLASAPLYRQKTAFMDGTSLKAAPPGAST